MYEMSTVVRCKNVEKYFTVGTNVVKAVNGVDLKLQEGEFVSVVGPSGSGKTTLLNLIGTLERPTNGDVIIDDTNVTTFNSKQLAILRRRKIGFIFQFFNLVDGLTAVENIELPLIFDNVEKEERNLRSALLIKEFNLEYLKDKFPEELSSGERQRVAIMRALISNPSVLLADEPTGNLDTKTGSKVLDLLVKLNREKNLTILMVTHDLMAAKRAEKIIYMKDGRVEKVENTTLTM